LENLPNGKSVKTGQQMPADSRARALRSPSGPGRQAARHDRPQHAKTELQSIGLENPVLLLEVLTSGIHQTRPSGMYIKPGNGRWALLSISSGTETTALSSKSTKLNFGRFNVFEKTENFGFVSVELCTGTTRKIGPHTHTHRAPKPQS
jgi:hypothetical protein